MLAAHHLRKNYGSLSAVADVNFTLQAGEILGYIGSNGAGKSTTVKIIAGLIEPSSGDVLFNGISIHRNLVDYKRRIGYVPEEPNLYPYLTAREYLDITPVAIWLIVALPLHAMLWSWRIALLHTAYVLMCSIALAQMLLLKFRKIPFACSYTASKDKVLVVVLLGLIGAALFSSVNARIELSLVAHPQKMFTAIAIFALILWGIRRYRNNLPQQDRVLIFEDRPASIVQRLEITK